MSQYDILAIGETLSKHRIPLNCEDGEEAFLDRFVFKSVRSKVLQKLLLIWYNLFYSERNQMQERIYKRLKEQKLPRDRVNIVWELKPKDVMDVIGCSSRTAKEYIDAMRCFYR